jgi:hypothetical protein
MGTVDLKSIMDKGLIWIFPGLWFLVDPSPTSFRRPIVEKFGLAIKKYRQFYAVNRSGAI